MKTKDKHAILKRLKEFRFHNVNIIDKKGIKKKRRHPAYVFVEKGNVYIYVIITHSSYVEEKIVVKLRRNPNPNDNSDAYYIAEVKSDTKDSFGHRNKGWKLDESDDIDIRKLFENKKR